MKGRRPRPGAAATHATTRRGRGAGREGTGFTTASERPGARRGSGFRAHPSPPDGALEPRVLADVILPTMPLRKGQSDTLQAARRQVAAEQAARLPEELTALIFARRRELPLDGRRRDRGALACSRRQAFDGAGRGGRRGEFHLGKGRGLAAGRGGRPHAGGNPRRRRRPGVCRDGGRRVEARPWVSFEPGRAAGEERRAQPARRFVWRTATGEFGAWRPGRCPGQRRRTASPFRRP